MNIMSILTNFKPLIRVNLKYDVMTFVDYFPIINNTSINFIPIVFRFI